MKEINGKNPQNARIKINYTRKKPTVKFSYPVKKKDSRTMGSMRAAVLLGWIVLFMPVYLGFAIAYDPIDQYYDATAIYHFSQCVALNPILTMTNYSEVRNEICKPERDLDLYSNKKWIMILVWILGWVPIYFPFKKHWDKLYPDWRALTANKKYHRFSNKEIRKYEGRYFVELPIFTNVVCDWNASKDFSKYVEEFEIEEYKFRYNRKKDMESTRTGKFPKYKYKKQRPKNELLWYARWYFKKKPEKGFLEVIYK